MKGGWRVFLCVCLCLQSVFCQFDFFNREERRYQPRFSGLNFLQPGRIRESLTSLFNGRDRNQYPYGNNRPAITNDEQNYGQQYPYQQYQQDNQQYQQNPPQNQQYPPQNQQYPSQNQQYPPQNQQYPSQNQQYPPQNQQYPPQNQQYPPQNPQFPPPSQAVQFPQPNQYSPQTPPFPQNQQYPPEFAQYQQYSNNQNQIKFGQNTTQTTINPVSGDVYDEVNFEDAPNKPNENIEATTANFVNFPVAETTTTTTTTAAPVVVETTEAVQTTTLAILTPVPDTESRNNFNVEGVFQPTCTTVDGEVGSCLSILQCEPYRSLLVKARTDEASVDILRKAHCGFDGQTPKVCCPRPGFETVPPAPVTTSTTEEPKSGRADEEDDSPVSELPKAPDCGQSMASLPRVVGGVKAKKGDFPWMALLGYKYTDIRWLCGGSLISSKHVLTAAHCIHGRETRLQVIRLGELDLSSEDDGTPIDVPIKTRIKHEQYDATAFTNDIGVLVLQRHVQFSDLIRPVCMPLLPDLRSNSFKGYRPFVAGWGDIAFRGEKATHLQVAQIPVVSEESCQRAFAAYKKQVIDQRVLCAGYEQGKVDACSGDSGGPFILPRYNPEDHFTYFYQIGVVSYGKKCAEPGFPGVYTRVSEFLPWLEKTVVNNS